MLIAGWVVFWAGAFTPLWRLAMGPPLREYLEIIGSQPIAWLWIAGTFVVGVLLTGLGLALPSRDRSVPEAQHALRWERGGGASRHIRSPPFRRRPLSQARRRRRLRIEPSLEPRCG